MPAEAIIGLTLGGIALVILIVWVFNNSTQLTPISPRPQPQPQPQPTPPANTNEGDGGRSSYEALIAQQVSELQDATQDMRLSSMELTTVRAQRRAFNRRRSADDMREDLDDAEAGRPPRNRNRPGGTQQPQPQGDGRRRDQQQPRGAQNPQGADAPSPMPIIRSL